jgi:dCTP deaminase
MSVLSAQTIRRLSLARSFPLIEPFVERGVMNGKSFGLSACTYDCRIDHDLVLNPNSAALASTMERVCLPNNICGSILDKSTYARLFMSAFNTHIDPGFNGFVTVELANLGEQIIRFEKGDPLCQIKFELLDYYTDLPYNSKYQNQERGPQAARLET